ncbi:LPS export ABC transporter periplasmic protein LptC [Stakelama sp. CBK3Z-3]|uniref:LPS export ABC transporter periplasmic protein LptC n=1 Tax=Stakelama flava TaxID=2860338 RepID=A0ABS6XLA7_9SPHN|nr:LPS export ABC transporter periplasmic protein LptC [Stakelama flava]
MSEIARRVRSQRQEWAAPGSPHDRVVATAQKVLPAAVGVLAAFLIIAPLINDSEMRFILDKGKVDVAQERMKLQSARYRGEDSKGRSFILTAGSAVQKSSAEPIVRLNDLAAQIQLADGPAQLKANQGRYDMKDDTVAVDGPITFRAANGYRMNTRDATIDLKARTMKSGGAVDGDTPQGTFSANRMSADLENHTVRLDGNAHLRIAPKQAKGQ